MTEKLSGYTSARVARYNSSLICRVGSRTRAATLIRGDSKTAFFARSRRGRFPRRRAIGRNFGRE